MLTYEDVIAFSDLDDTEVDEIAAHAHVPSIVAVEIGHCMIDGTESEQRLSKLLRNVANEASASGDTLRSSYLYQAIQNVRARHQAA